MRRGNLKSAVVSSLDTKVKIANMYYKENMSQQEIAEALDMSRTTVSRILKNCLDEGIVSIHIKNTSTYQYELELQVKKKYGLKHVCVVSNQDKKNKVIQEISAVYGLMKMEPYVRRIFRIGRLPFHWMY